MTDAIALRLYLADEAWLVLSEIGSRATEINRANLGRLFGMLQNVLSDRIVLLTTGIFEQRGRGSNAFSLTATARFIADHEPAFLAPQRHHLEDFLGRWSGSKEAELKALTEEELVRRFVRQTFPGASRGDRKRLRGAFESLRTLRNKRIAHHDQMASEDIAKTTWSLCHELQDFAKAFVAAIGWAYLSTAYTFGRRGKKDHWVMWTDAQMTRMAAKRLFELAGIKASAPPEEQD